MGVGAWSAAFIPLQRATGGRVGMRWDVRTVKRRERRAWGALPLRAGGTQEISRWWSAAEPPGKRGGRPLRPGGARERRNPAVTPRHGENAVSSGAPLSPALSPVVPLPGCASPRLCLSPVVPLPGCASRGEGAGRARLGGGCGAIFCNDSYHGSRAPPGRRVQWVVGGPVVPLRSTTG